MVVGVLIRGILLFFRAVFPRCRYDQLMEVCWKVMLPRIFLWFLVRMFFVLYMWSGSLNKMLVCGARVVGKARSRRQSA